MEYICSKWMDGIFKGFVLKETSGLKGIKHSVKPILSFLPFFILTFNIGFAASETTPQLSNTQDANKGVSTSIQQDSMLGLIGQLKSFYSFNADQAVALELDGGPRVLRANGTYAFALNDNNRVKLTTEYLREDLDFSFYTGDTRQWVGQGAIGAAYQYALDSGWLKNLNVGAHYSSAQSKDLATQSIVDADDYAGTDYRRIAGGKDLNGNADADLQLWKDSTLTLGPDYDRVRYDTKYNIQDGQDAQGFGGHARLEQILKHNLSLELDSALSQVYDIYGAGLNWIWYSNNKTVLSTGFNSSYTQDKTAERNFWVNALTLNVVWDSANSSAVPEKTDIKGGVSLPAASAAPNPLATWVQTPAVRMPDVLAISDERIEGTEGADDIDPFVSITGACPVGTSVNYTNGQYSANGGWYQSYPQGLAPQAGLISFDSANIMASPSGQVACLYNLVGPPPTFLPLGNLTLVNNIYQNAEGSGSGWASGYSSFWPGAPYPVSFCNISGGSSCTFNTVAPN